MLEKFSNEPVVTLLKVLKVALDHYISLIEQGQTVRNRLRACLLYTSRCV